ncbi:MAG: hypothetical protein ACOY0S_03850 [Patescibacteria group bacterium]
MKKHALSILLVIVLSYWSIKPLTSPGYFPMHDDTQVGRVVAMGRALRAGQFPVRWVSDLGYGYGYPLFNFYGPLPYYVGGFFYLLGFSGLVATKLMFGLGIILAGITMYIFLANILASRVAALVGSLFYLYAPYHAVQIYVRGAVGEFWILVFLPLIFLGLWKRSALIGGLGLAGAILSHTLLGYATTVFLIVGLIGYWLIRAIARKLTFSLLISHFSLLFIGLGLSAFFWLPAMGEMRFTAVGGQIGPTANFRDHFVCPSQLWNSLWGFGGSIPGCVDGISFKLGKLHLLMALLTLGAWFLKPQIRKVLNWPLLFGVTVTQGAIFFTLPVSVSLWNIMPWAAYIQYPWRFLTFAIFGLAILVGSGVMIFAKKIWRWLAVAALVSGVIFLNAKWFRPQYQYLKPAAEFESIEELRFRVSRISDEYLPPLLPRPSDVSGIVRQVVEARGDLRVSNVWDNGVVARFIVDSPKEQEIKLRRAYFPGWHYWLNGREIKPQVTSGIPSFGVPSGESIIDIQFRNTPIRLVGNLASVATLIILVLIYDKKAIS